jgi:hypothetical protein
LFRHVSTKLRVVSVNNTIEACFFWPMSFMKALEWRAFLEDR